MKSRVMDLNAVMNSIWNALPAEVRGMDYASDFWAHDRAAIEALRTDQSITLRMYNRGTHVWDKLMREYMLSDKTAFGGSGEVVYVTVTSEALPCCENVRGFAYSITDIAPSA